MRGIGYLTGRPGLRVWGQGTQKEGDQYIRQLLAESNSKTHENIEMLRLTQWISGAWPLPMHADVDKKGLHDALRTLVKHGYLRQVRRGRYGAEPGRLLRQAVAEMRTTRREDTVVLGGYRTDLSPEEDELVMAALRQIKDACRILALVAAHGQPVPSFEFDEPDDIAAHAEWRNGFPHGVVGHVAHPTPVWAARWAEEPHRYDEFLQASKIALNHAQENLRQAPALRPVTTLPEEIWAVVGLRNEDQYRRMHALMERMYEQEQHLRTGPAEG